MTDRIITIIGGSGFLGRYVVRELARAGYRLRVVCRHPEAAAHLKTAGDLGQIQLVYGSLAKPETVTRHIPGAFAVVNLVGILFESGQQTFSGLHAQGAEKVAQAARAAKVPVLVHVSSLGVNKSSRSHYARSKVLGENAVRAAFAEATILRPSVIFGAEDQFFNQFARMAALAHALPLIGGGKTLFQPVYVADVARAVRVAVENPECRGRVFELGGPEVFTFRQLMAFMLRATGLRALLLPLPFSLAGLLAFFTELLPRPPLTRDQVRLLRYDNVVDHSMHGFKSLGITPAAVELVAPDYLARFRKRARHGAQ